MPSSFGVEVKQPFRINTPAQPNRLSPWLARPLENFLCFPRLNALYGQVSQESAPAAFLEASLSLLNIQVQVSPADTARIPTSGPVVVVANHPFGLIEGMLLAHILFKVRPDVKVMTNFLLAQVPQTQEMCIFVDPFDSSRSTQANIGGIRSALSWLNQGKMLVVFPAGEVAHVDLQKGQIVDPVWNENVARLIRRSGAAALPAYIQGNNGLFFHLAGLVHPRLRTALLPREFLNKCDRQVEIRLGSPLSARHVGSFTSDQALITYLRQRTYALSSRQAEAGPKKPPVPLRLPFSPKPPRFNPIVGAQPQALLQGEINNLPPEQQLSESGNLAVFYAEAGQFYRDTVHTMKWAVPSKDMAVDFVNGFTASAMMSTGSMGGVKENAKFEFGTAFLPKKKEFGCCTGGAGLAILANASAEQQEAGMKYLAFVTSPENTTFWAQNTGYMPVRKSALQSQEMQNYFEQFPQFKTATEQIALTKPQDAARVFVPNGDQIIGKGLEQITVQNQEVATAFAEVQAILEQEAAPVIEALRAVEAS